MAADTRINVIASTFNGSSTHLFASGSSSVLELKERLAEPLQVPVICQLLLLDTVELVDTEQLSVHGLQDLSLTVLVSLRVVNDTLAEGIRENVTIPVLVALKKLSAIDEQTVERLRRVLFPPRGKKKSSASKSVKVACRSMACGILAKHAALNNSHAFEALKHMFFSLSARDRELGIKHMAESMHGDQIACSSLCSDINAAPQKVRRKKLQSSYTLVARLEALGKMLSVDNSEVVECLGKVLQRTDISKCVKIAACACIGNVLNIGCFASTLEGILMSCLQHASDRESSKFDLFVWRCALRYISPYLAKNTELVIDTCDGMFSRESSQPKRACELLVSLVDRGNARAISMITKYLAGGFFNFQRAAAAKSLGYIASIGDDGVVDLLISALRDEAQVAQEAVTALGRIAERVSSCAIAAVLRCIEHGDSWMRRAAPNTLARLAVDHDSADVLSALVRSTSALDVEVAEASLHALVGMGPNVLGSALEAARACLTHRDQQLRKKAVKVLVKHAKPLQNYDRYILAIKDVACPSNPWEFCEHVSQEVVHGLLELSNAGNKFANEALSSLASESRIGKVAAMAETALNPAPKSDNADYSSDSECETPWIALGKSWTRLVQDFDELTSSDESE